MVEIGSTSQLITRFLFVFASYLLGVSFMYAGGELVFLSSAFPEETYFSNELSYEKSEESCAIFRSPLKETSTEENSWPENIKRPLQPTHDNALYTDPSVAMASIRLGDVQHSHPNPYLARIERIIKHSWSPPSVNLSDKAIIAVVGFRLERDGQITNVMIEKSSGNGSYDVAAQRAVSSVSRSLPPFPVNIPDSYLSISFTFAVEDQRITHEAKIFRQNHIDRCLQHLEALSDAVKAVPETEVGLKKLRQLFDKLPLSEDFEKSSDVANIRGSVRDLRGIAEKRTEEITKQLVAAEKLRAFDRGCECTIQKAQFPMRLRDEPVDSSLPETKTLGRAFCTAVNGGGTVEFRVIDQKPPTIGILVATKKRRFAVVLQKKMKADLTEEWTAVEVQTPSDRKPVLSFLGYSFMDQFPEMVQNE